jgi:GT2 family glycosyltransferase
VIDNGSGSASQQGLEQNLKKYPHTTIINIAENVGLVRANNLGFRHAMTAGVEYIWVLNNDTLVSQEASRTLTQYFLERKLKPRSNLLSSVITDSSGLSVWTNGLKDIPILNFPKSIDKGKVVASLKLTPDLRPVEYLSSCSIFCHRQFIEAKGYLPEEYFMYFDDLDWSSRGRCLVIQKPLVQHLVASTVGKAGTDSFNVFKAYWYGRNMILYYFKRKKISSLEKAIFFIITISLWAGLYIREVRTLKAFVKGLGDGLWQTE